ncbi:hypothetical protein FA13DRAFT_1724357, partial [Coprinellus micaceus]
REDVRADSPDQKKYREGGDNERYEEPPCVASTRVQSSITHSNLRNSPNGPCSRPNVLYPRSPCVHWPLLELLIQGSRVEGPSRHTGRR